MLRKLEEKDRKTVLDFLGIEPAINLFIIGDIENFGFDEDFQDVWGSFDGKELKGVLLRYHENFIPYYRDELFDIKEFKNIIISFPGKKIISGKESITDNFKELFKNQKVKSMYFCELNDDKKLLEYTYNIKTAAIEDTYKIFDLLDTIEEFRDTDSNSLDRIKKAISRESSRIYYIENDEGKALTTVRSTAENSCSAMIVGVATREGYRRKGYMSQCLSKLCKDILSEGKTLCLFYYNPEAGSVYHKIGFRTIGRWQMIVEKSPEEAV